MLAAALSAQAVPLDNWRRPFYRIAAERGETASSPSRLFWDDLGQAGVFDTRLWPDSAAYGGNHLCFEPALAFEARTDTFTSGKSTNLHFDMLSDFRYEGLSVRAVLDADQEYSALPDYVWKQDRGAAGRIDEAYVQYSGDHGFARFGRINRSWGPFPGRSILLSDHPFTYDAFEWGAQLPFLEFRHLFAAFPRRRSHLDAAGGRINRYLTAHALNFIFGEWASVGVSETVLFTRDREFPDFHYLNPVGIYTVTNTNAEGGTGNLMLGFQGWGYPFTKKVLLRGQVVLDDIQVDNEDDQDQEPAHWACDVGGTWIDPLPLELKHHLTVEYRYLSKWMYTVDWNNTKIGGGYRYLGRSLGYPTIDGDELSVRLAAIGDNFWTATLGFGLARQDTNTIDTPWPDTSVGYFGYRREPSLSKRGNVSTTLSFPLAVSAYFRDFCDLQFELRNRWVENPNHDRSPGFVYDPGLMVRVTAHYSDLVFRFERKEKQKQQDEAHGRGE